MKPNRSTVVFMLAAVLLLSCKTPKGPTAPNTEEQAESDTDTEAETIGPHATVTAFISARCPHAADAVRTLLGLKTEFGDSLGIHFGYVGALDADGNIDRAVGEDEINAAVGQICAGMSSTEASWYAFLTCLYEGELWRSQPQGMHTCLEKSGIDRTEVDACIASGEGEAMLAQAYNASSASRIQASPTLIVDRHLYAGPRDKDALRRYLCYTAGLPETRPSLCDTVTPPAEISATMLYDRRCNSVLKCDVEGEIAVLEKLIPGFSLTREDFSSEKGRALYERIRAANSEFRNLPVILIDDAADAGESFKALLGDYLLPFEKGYMFALGGGWDPMAEICDNQKDDNGNGAVDCADEACGSTRLCREEKPGRLDLFIMSECPYAVDILPHADKLLKHFGRDRSALDFHLQFIGEVAEDGTPLSMHGESEIAEDKRMICAQEIYPGRYKFMEYVTCRAASFESTDWAACVPKGMKASKIKACAEGEKGLALLKESFALADELGVQGSPSWILNNKEDMNARRLPDMIVSYCGANDRPACKVPLPEPDASSTDAPAPSLRCD